MRVCRDFSMYKFAYGFLMDFGSWSYRCVLLKVGMYAGHAWDYWHASVWGLNLVGAGRVTGCTHSVWGVHEITDMLQYEGWIWWVPVGRQGVGTVSGACMRSLTSGGQQKGLGQRRGVFKFTSYYFSLCGYFLMYSVEDTVIEKCRWICNFLK